MERKTGRSKAEKKNGQKWVEGNYDAKVNAKAANGGELPYTPALETSYHPLSRDWSCENLPEILFYLNPPPSRFQSETVQYLRDEETGDIIRSEEGNQIKDFEILPRYISVEVEGWMVEAWRRIDTRITYQDILDRQRTDHDFGGIGLKKLSKNALQNHCYRDSRKILNNWVEYGRRDEPHRTEVETIEELSYKQIVYNTVLQESSAFQGRLVKVTFKRRTEDGLFHAESVQVTPTNVLRTTFDILHFIDAALPKLSPDNHMTASMDAAWQMSLLLMERAQLHGKQHWSKLDRNCLPVTWFDRLEKSKKTISNPTYDGGCAVCTWEEGRDAGAASNDKRKPEDFVTARKRGRAPSGSNSDEPLVKKRRRAQVAKAELDSDSESKAEVIIDDESPGARRGTSAARSIAVMTPVQPRRSSRAVSRDQEDYDAETEDCDDDATQGMLSSSNQSVWSSCGVPDTRYQNSPSYIGLFESPMARYSSLPYYDAGSLYHTTDIKPAAATRPQPRWEEIGITARCDLPYPGSDRALELANYQGRPDRREEPFASTYLNQSFSSGDIDAETAATSYVSGDEINDVAHSMQLVNAKMQQNVTNEPNSDTYSYQARPRHSGRMTAQGGRLTDIFSSPSSRRTSDLDISSHIDQPSDSMLDSIFSRRRSFHGYLPAEILPTPYGHGITTDVQWKSGNLDYVSSHLALQDSNEFIEDDYNQLPEAPTLHTHLDSKSTSFLDLLSSDPAMPEEYLDFLDTEITNENEREQAPTEYDTVVQGNTFDQGSLRFTRQTPPLLDC